MQLLNCCYHRLLFVMVSRESFGPCSVSPPPKKMCLVSAPHLSTRSCWDTKARISMNFENFTPWNKLKLYCKALVSSTGRTENIPLRKKRLDELNDDYTCDKQVLWESASFFSARQLSRFRQQVA